MRTMIRSSATAAAVGVALAAGLSTVGASPALADSARPITIFQSPAIGGPDIGPAATPDGMFQTISAIATTGEAPGVTTFSVTDLKSSDGQNGRFYITYDRFYITINWQNLESGAAGDVDLRYWERSDREDPDPSYAAGLPTSASVETGTGPIVATVTRHNSLYQSPPSTLIPGYWALWA